MELKFGYDTYQDVRRNLFLYSTPFLIGAGFFAFFRILPPSTQQAVERLLEFVSNTQPWKGLLGSSVGVAVFATAAFLLTEIIQIHDQWYDKHVIKWRHQYSTDFILPRLVQPWLSRMNYRFFEMADANPRQFQEQLFYPYVGDRDLKIPKNKLIRFYEVITVYWLTQINELVLLGMSVLIVYYGSFGPAELSYRIKLFNDLVIMLVAFIVNRAWAQSSLVKVRHATEDEIAGILDDYNLKNDLEQRVIRICQHYAIPYEEVHD